MGSSSIYRNFSLTAVAGLFLSGLFGFAVVSGIQLSGELILVTTLIIVESSLAMTETRDHTRVELTSTGRDLKDISGTRASDLVYGTWGNVSCCDRKEGVIMITPSGLDKDKLNPEDMVVLNFKGSVLTEHTSHQ